MIHIPKAPRSGKMMVVSVLPKIAKVVVLVMVVLTFILIINIGLQKQELVACKKLVRYSQTYSPLFYITKAEKAMCDELDVFIDAPVK